MYNSLKVKIALLSTFIIIWISFLPIMTDAATSEIPRTRITYLTTQWPVTGPTYSSPFWSRLKASSNYRYDFHRGVDFPKSLWTPVYDFADGTVYGIYSATDSSSPYFIDGGNVVIIKHTLSTPYTIHGKTTSTIYSLYMHLETISTVLKKWATVKKGTRIGTIWQTGTTEYNHLHFETRVWTACSREFQINNPAAGCSQFFAWDPQDPHVNPFIFLPYATQGGLTTTITSISPLTVKIASARNDLIFNSLQVTSNGVTKTINLNDRTGIDPTNIDNATYDWINISPAKYNSTSANYEISFTFNSFNEYNSIKVLDIWWGGTQITP